MTENGVGGLWSPSTTKRSPKEVWEPLPRTSVSQSKCWVRALSVEKLAGRLVSESHALDLGISHHLPGHNCNWIHRSSPLINARSLRVRTVSISFIFVIPASIVMAGMKQVIQAMLMVWKLEVDLGLDNELSSLRFTKQHWWDTDKEAQCFDFLCSPQDFSEPLIGWRSLWTSKAGLQCAVLLNIPCPPKSLDCVTTFWDACSHSDGPTF